MRAYVEFGIKAFINNMVYRFDYIIGIASNIISVFVYVAIWKCLYGPNGTVDGVSMQSVITNFVLGIGITSAFFMDEYMVARKVRSGDIASDLLKPVNYTQYVFAVNFGNTCFRLLTNFLPSLLVCALFIGVLPPASVAMFALFLLSVLFGYMILFYVSYMVSLISFWHFNIWSFTAIKGVCIQVLAGIVMPIWFMPEWLVNIIKATPFDSIFYIPVSIYLGNLEANEIAFNLLKQVIWIGVLYAASTLMWRSGVKKLVVQGG